MSTQTILVIDDSATIRKMVDSHLSQEGYRVVLAPTGELGVEMAREIQPDLILLDHQLPGTTGIQVCREIIQFSECQHIPFVVSSTLRKQAYVEYMDVSNVVDSLPKPFKPDLLRMTIANALETGAMIVSSQANGTAVPEVVDETFQPALSGDFRCIGLREVIDFLNNGRRNGLLEVETQKNRVGFYIKDGRILGAVSASFDADEVATQLPESIQELSPLLQFTMSSGSSTRVDGLVELMDKKVLDPRMLRLLLRHQTAALTRYCFLNNPTSFAFIPDREIPSLFAKAAIDTSLAAILVDGAVNYAGENDPPLADDVGWVRNSLRGQNPDRAGLSAKHVKLLSCLEATPRNTADLAVKAGLPLQETTNVLEGFLLAEWVGNKDCCKAQTLIAFEPDAANASVIRGIIEDPGSGWTGNVIRDDFSFQLLLKRKSPDAVLLPLCGDHELQIPEKLLSDGVLNETQAIVLIAPAEEGSSLPVATSLLHLPVLRRPYKTADVLDCLRTRNSHVARVTPDASAVSENLIPIPSGAD